MDDRSAILIVDSNVGFATMLQESLEQDGDYHATVAYTGTDALEMASDQAFDLAIIDLGIDVSDGLDGAAVARRLRREQPDLRLMLIPLEGDVLSEEVADLAAQSVLPKPFFLPDLPGMIEDALTQPIADSPEPTQLREPEKEPASEIKPPDIPDTSSPEIIRELEGLAREINADAVLLTSREDILASVGQLATGKLTRLAQIIAESHQSSGQIAEILSRERRRFEQSIEGDGYMLYSLAVIEDVVLSAALRTNVALGIVRHRAKGVARRLSNLISSPNR